jgi:hypothetical protein
MAEQTAEGRRGERADPAVKKHVKISKSALEACKNAEAIVVCTEWDEFKQLDWEESELATLLWKREWSHGARNGREGRNEGRMVAAWLVTRAAS